MSFVQSYLMTARDVSEAALEQALHDLGAALSQIAGSLGAMVLRSRADARSFSFLEFWVDDQARDAAGLHLPNEVMGRIKDALGAPPQVVGYDRLGG